MVSPGWLRYIQWRDRERVRQQTVEEQQAALADVRINGECVMNVRYPDITVRLTGQDGNAYAVLGHVHRALRLAGISKAERDVFMKEASAGDYDNLLQTCMRWVNVE